MNKEKFLTNRMYTSSVTSVSNGHEVGIRDACIDSEDTVSFSEQQSSMYAPFR